MFVEFATAMCQGVRYFMSSYMGVYHVKRVAKESIYFILCVCTMLRINMSRKPSFHTRVNMLRSTYLYVLI